MIFGDEFTPFFIPLKVADDALDAVVAGVGAEAWYDKKKQHFCCFLGRLTGLEPATLSATS